MTTLTRTAGPRIESAAVSLLIVEDDLPTAELTAALLQEGTAVEIHRATSIADALEVLSGTVVDCVLLDVHLPDGTGPTAVHAIHAAAPGMPILLLSGMESGALQRIAIQSGAQVSLPKDHLDASLLWHGVTTAMDRELSEASNRHNARLARLLELAGRPSAVDSRITTTLAEMTAELGMDVGLVCHIDAEAGTNTIRYANAPSPDLAAGTSFPLESTYCSIAWETESPMAVEHMGASPHADHLCYRTHGLEAYIGVPLRVDGERFGTINFVSGEVAPRRFSRHDVDYLERAAGLIAGWLAEKVRAEELEETRERFRLAFDNAPIGMVVASLDGRVLQANQSFSDCMGLSPDLLAGVDMLDLTHPDDVATTRAFMATTLTESANGSMEKRYIRRDGSTWWGQVHSSVLRGPDGQPQYFVNQIEDVTERRAAQRRLSDMALHDTLTGLPNRALLQDRLTQELATAAREGTTTAVLFLDLDRFKHVNDSFGHAAGDTLLQTIADRLQQVVRPNDTVARQGGDEFVILCTGLNDRADLTRILSRINDAVERPVRIEDHVVSVGVSIGVAFADATTTTSPDALLRDADTAMYRAKGRGRALAEVHTDALREDALRHLTLSTDLRDAILAAPMNGESAEHGLRVVYQPVLATDTGRACGVETLVRWQHPTHGLLTPDDFLSIAEETGLIVPMGRWVLAQALHDWSASHLTVSVNHSVSEIAAPDFVWFVEEQLAASGVAPERLCIEVTESSVLLEHGSAMAALRRLREMGVRLAIDDFGAGYTSLAHLTDSPFTELKIDRSFIANADEAQWSIVDAIVRVCDTLGLHSVIEGVEDLESLDRARRIGCDASQGYVHSRPVPLEQARTIVLA